MLKHSLVEVRLGTKVNPKSAKDQQSPPLFSFYCHVPSTLRLAHGKSSKDIY